MEEPKTEPKMLVICCDGTGNQYGENNTNVVLLYQLLEQNWGKGGNPGPQVRGVYDPGVGTGGPRGRWWIEKKAKQIWAQATGFGVQKNVEDAYRWLMSQYEKDDSIYLFGFSRGAFTVRSLAGMLHKVGLLKPGLENIIGYASDMYNNGKSNVIAKEFKETFSRNCPVHFIGVWDTVDSRYLSAGRDFHDATLNPDVKYGYHALAIDERRGAFPPCLWGKGEVHQKIEQVWFPGVHSNVGGWYPDRGLSNGALHWMVQKAVKAVVERKDGLPPLALPFDEERLEREHEANPEGTLNDSYGLGWFWQEVLMRVMKIIRKVLMRVMKIIRKVLKVLKVRKEREEREELKKGLKNGWWHKLAGKLKKWIEGGLNFVLGGVKWRFYLSLVIAGLLGGGAVCGLLGFLGWPLLPEACSRVEGALGWMWDFSVNVFWCLKDVGEWLLALVGLISLLSLLTLVPLAIVCAFVRYLFKVRNLRRGLKFNDFASGRRVQKEDLPKDKASSKAVQIIPPGSNLHVSVRERMESKKTGYRPENLLGKYFIVDEKDNPEQEVKVDGSKGELKSVARP